MLIKICIKIISLFSALIHPTFFHANPYLRQKLISEIHYRVHCKIIKHPSIYLSVVYSKVLFNNWGSAEKFLFKEIYTARLLLNNTLINDLSNVRLQYLQAKWSDLPKLCLRSALFCVEHDKFQLIKLELGSKLLLSD